MESLRIVIADDEPIIRLDLRKTLENMGHQVVGEAGDGAKAVEVAREMKPDIVILDIKMPELDGIDGAKVITTEGIAPVLLLTAYSQKDLVDRAKDAGVFQRVVGLEARGGGATLRSLTLTGPAGICANACRMMRSDCRISSTRTR